MNRQQIAVAIVDALATLTASNNIINSGGSLEAPELRDLLNSQNSVMLNLLTELNSSTFNSEDDTISGMWNDDKSLTGNRRHGMDQNIWEMFNGKQFKYSCSVLPPAGEASFAFHGYGSFGGDEKIADFKGFANTSVVTIHNQSVEVSRPMGVQSSSSGFHSITTGGSVSIGGAIYANDYLQVGNGYNRISGDGDYKMKYGALNGHQFGNTDQSRIDAYLYHDNYASTGFKMRGHEARVIFNALDIPGSNAAFGQGVVGMFYDGESHLRVVGDYRAQMQTGGDYPVILSVSRGGIYGSANVHTNADVFKQNVTHNLNDDLFVSSIDRATNNGLLQFRHAGMSKNLFILGAGQNDGNANQPMVERAFQHFAVAADDYAVPAWKINQTDVIKLFKATLPTNPTNSEIAAVLAGFGLVTLV